MANRLPKIFTIAVVIAMAIVTGWSQAPLAADHFGLKDIPEIKNKKPIHIALADLADICVPYLKKFEEKTGVKVSHEVIVFNALYGKEIMELQARTGAYDVVVTESSWTNEWKDYLYPMYDLAAKYDPKGIDGLKTYLAGFDPGMLRMASTRDRVLMGIPVQTYTMLMAYRKDIFDNAEEKANFKKTYKYDLAPATTWEQILDQAEFFTRKKGEKMAGKTLDHDMYGMSMMAGRYPHVQDEVGSRLWSKGGRWATTVRKAGMVVGDPIGFKVTEKDKALMEWAFDNYQKSMKFAPPGSDNAYWDFACAEFSAGNTVILCPMYSSIWPLISPVEKKVAGAKVGAAVSPGMRPYTGNFHLSPSVDSKNPEAAYWLLKYLGSYEVQESMCDGGWATPRVDVLSLPKYRAAKYQATLGWIPEILETFKSQASDANDYLHFNSSAFGKLYDQMMIVSHENAIKKRTPKQSVEEWIRVFTQIQKKFGQLPVME
ncbi:MAG: extracellular solute-binding protein [Deltaproteobacteria bacterium]|nr:extracellular solute-binding protein [Deltaproteobacteria bacterium]